MKYSTLWDRMNQEEKMKFLIIEFEMTKDKAAKLCDKKVEELPKEIRKEFRTSKN